MVIICSHIVDDLRAKGVVSLFLSMPFTRLDQVLKYFVVELIECFSRDNICCFCLDKLLQVLEVIYKMINAFFFIF